MAPRITILLCSKDRHEDLAPTLESLANEIKGRDDVEVLAIDNGSSDDTPRVLQWAAENWGWLRPRRIEVRGKARAINVALPDVRGEVLVTTDDDVRFEPGWLDEMTKGIFLDVVQGTVGRIAVPPDRDFPWMSDIHRSLMAATTHYGDSRMGQLVGASMAVHRRVFTMVPQFDPELGPGALGFYEDTLFSHQVQQAGFRIAYAPDAVVWHHFRLDRLERPSFLRRAQGQGYCEAYGGYHWYHDFRDLDWVQSELAKVEQEAAPLLAGQVSCGPPTDAELITMNTYGRWTYYLEQAKRPPNYKKRGLIRITPDPD